MEPVFVKIAETSEKPSGQTKSFKIEEKEILVANINGAYYAISNICSHMGGDLSKGTLEGNVVTCPSIEQNLMSQLVRLSRVQKLLLCTQKSKTSLPTR